MTACVVARYTEPDEFLAELARDRDKVERGVVHASKLARPGGPAGSLTAVLVHAGHVTDGRPILLDRFVGYLWSHPNDAEVQEKATVAVRIVEEGVAELGLELRAGLLELRHIAP